MRNRRRKEEYITYKMEEKGRKEKRKLSEGRRREGKEEK